jgi:hypothetical protein
MEDKIENLKSNDLIDKLIFEEGIKIQNVFIDKELNLMILILTNGKIIKSKLDLIAQLSDANQFQLNNFRLVGGGIGIEWEELDVDLSLKSFIKNVAINTFIKQIHLQEPIELELV